MLLMHKDIPVADLTITTGAQIIAARILNTLHMPVGTYSEKPDIVVAKLRRWVETRMIPGGRQEKEYIQKIIGCSVRAAVQKNKHLNLTDCYWLKQDETQLCSWSDINYHANGFSQQLAESILRGDAGQVQDIRTPDLTTDGILKKTWVISDGVPSLIKFGNIGPNADGRNLLSANEVAACRIAEMIGIKHADYQAIELAIPHSMACITPCFIHPPHEEFVTAHQISEEYRLDGDQLYLWFVKAGMQQEVDKMILFDHIIHNTDRHERNFGVIRNPDTLEITGFAPLFDSGSSFGWNYSPELHDMGETKPFRGSRMDQLKLLKSMNTPIPDEQTVKNILQETYEWFGLPEQNFRIAETDVRNSYRLLLK